MTEQTDYEKPTDRDQGIFRGKRVARRFLSPDGMIVLVGKTASDNDVLSLQIGEPQDFWMHVAGDSGSHVVIRNPERLDRLPRETLRFAASLAAPRYLTVLVGVFALAALLLSIVGIYGVMAHFVEQHLRDIGIRLALGGEPSDVRRMIVLQGMQLVALGVGVGLGVAYLCGRFLATLVYGVSPTDPIMMLTVALVLGGVAALACLVPGRRAAQLDPALILREQF